MSDGPALVVVDDETDLREAVAEYLTRRGLDVRQAPDGAALRRLLAERPADLVLLDISMPGEDGLTIARWLRAESDVGIVMLSAAGDVVDRVVGLEVGADDYVAKPVDLRELLARLRAVLRRREARAALTPTRPTSQPTPAVPTSAPALAPTLAPTLAPSPNPTLRVGRNRLDLAARRLFDSDGREIALGAAEFALLKIFTERPGRTLSREALLELSHDRGDDREDRSIDVRIARLRRKIEATPDQPQVIRTVRGMGYVFDPDADPPLGTAPDA